MNLETMIDKNRVRRAFSRQAHAYEENAYLQRDVAIKLVSFIRPTSHACPESSIHPSTGSGRTEGRRTSRLTAIDIGIGTGFASKELLKRYPDTCVFGCDIARGMLKEVSGADTVLTEADAEHLPYKDEVFDLAFSSLAMQWTNLDNSIRDAFRVLRPDGRFYFSTFGGATLRELTDSYSSAWRSLGIKGMPITMSFESLPGINAGMEIAGFKDIQIKSELLISRYESPEALLKSLKAIGAGNPSREFHPSRALLLETFRIYRERYGAGGISASFEVIYAWGKKR